MGPGGARRLHAAAGRIRTICQIAVALLPEVRYDPLRDFHPRSEAWRTLRMRWRGDTTVAREHACRPVSHALRVPRKTELRFERRRRRVESRRQVDQGGQEVGFRARALSCDGAGGDGVARERDQHRRVRPVDAHTPREGGDAAHPCGRRCEAGGIDAQDPDGGGAGLPGFAIDAWYGIMAPTATPRKPSCRSSQSRSERSAAARPTCSSDSTKWAARAIVDTPAPVGAACIRPDMQRYAKVIRQAGLRKEP